MLKGHVRKDCPNETVCYICKTPGHKKGDPECPSVKGEEGKNPFAGDYENRDTEGSASSESEDDAKSKSGERNVSQMLQGALMTKSVEKQAAILQMPHLKHLNLKNKALSQVLFPAVFKLISLQAGLEALLSGERWVIELLKVLNRTKIQEEQQKKKKKKKKKKKM